MKIRKEPELSLAMLRQLESYIHTRDESGWYYGNRAEFEKRHEVLKEWIAAQLVKVDQPKVKVDSQVLGENNR